MQAEPTPDFNLDLVAPPATPNQVAGDKLFDEEVEAYSRAQAEDDPDVARKADIALKQRQLREAAEDRELDRNMRRAQHDRQMQMIDDVLNARKTYANKIFTLVVAWLIAIGVILIAQGFGNCLGFALNDKVILALIVGTTLNVLGIFTIVANFLFPKNGGHLLAALQSPTFSQEGSTSVESSAAKPPKKRRAKGKETNAPE